MGERTIETRAIISAEDDSASAFASFLRRLAKMESAVRASNVGIGSADRESLVSRKAHLAVQREMLKVEKETAKEQARAQREMDKAREEALSGRQLAKAMALSAIAHKDAEFFKDSMETYREFDKERRYGRAVMGISDEDQEPLVAQAIHMGGTTKYNDIAVLEAQRDLAARGLNKDQILGMMPAAADLGQAMDLGLPDAVKQMESAIFGFKKAVGTTQEAMDSARRTADVQVKAAKISGMTPEDIQQLYKRDATPARLSGVSEETMLAFGGISKKGGIGGDEASTAFRALLSAANAPTRGAKEALLANGLDYSKYQKKLDHIDVDPFVRNVAAQYGVRLGKSAIAGLGKVFSDPKVLNDPALFTPAVTSLLQHALQGKDAKSLKSIAGMANRFRTASGGGADVNALMIDLMTAIHDKGGIALSNAIFGAKQGGRIANALADGDYFKKLVTTLKEDSDGYAKKVSDDRMAGFDGAVSRFDGAVRNLESAIGRAFDNNGKGGLLTSIADGAGNLVQSLAEAPPALQRLAAEAGIAAGIFAGFKGAEALMGGFGLKSAAGMLMTAAEKQIEAAAITSGESSLLGGGKTPAGRMGRVLKTLPLVATGIVALDEFTNYMVEEGKKEGVVSESDKGFVKRNVPPMGGNAHRSTFLPPSPYGALAPRPAPPAPVDVKVGPVAPLQVDVKVTAASPLLQAMDQLKRLEAALKAHADTGPGGLGETRTGQ